MIDRSLIWTGTLNETALAGRPKPKIGFYDTTLRDGEQAVGMAFDVDEKVEIARMVDALGVGRIEAGFPRVSEEDRIAIREISKAGLAAEIWGFARAVIEDVAAVAELDLHHSVVEAPVSQAKLDAIGVSHDTLVERVRKAVRFGTDNGLRVAFFAVDSTRGDLAFLERVYKTALDAGAKELVVVDTLGIATPEAVAFLIGRIRGWCGDALTVHFHGHNDFGLGTACALAAAAAGASWIHGTVDGIGERAGNADLPQIAMALEMLYGVDTGFAFDRIRTTAARLRAIGGYSVEPWKSIVGDNVFIRETGAVAAQFHIPPAIEPYSSQVLATRRGIVLGKKSGVASIAIKARELGLDVAEDRIPTLLAEVKRAAIAKRGLVSDDEFTALVRGPRRA